VEHAISHATHAAAAELEVSIVIPCLNEAETLASCIRKAQEGLRELGTSGEVIVADNGSTDDSVTIAQQLGARVVGVAAPGYGSALMGGIEAARGRYIIMGDADDSYDFRQTPRFVQRLRQGDQLVMGCRLPSGGGVIEPGAMPWAHRLIGNPLFTYLARRWFGARINDIYCGLRGFNRDLYYRLHQRCTGMEFATEMVIKASLARERVSEVPITLHRDGRTLRPPHLKTLRDGWRTLRFFLLCTPRWLFLAPGMVLIMLGLLGYALALPELTIGGVRFSAHTLMVSTLLVLCGYQSVLFALLAKTFAVAEGFLPPDARMDRFYRLATLERGVVVSLVVMAAGAALLLAAVNRWRVSGFGELNYAATMRLVIPGAACFALAFQTVLWGFFVSLLGMKRRR
jgi:glycosyltransferase involved in cell wall biosynthesis